MAQAAPASTTRRALLSVGAALPAIIATPVIAKEIGKGEAWRLRKRAFIEQVAGFSPNGRFVATRAMAMDLDPDDCIMIELAGPRHLRPQLHFQRDGDTSVTVVGPRMAILHGPVL